MREEQLIERSLAGDPRAYADLVRSYQRMVYTVCHRVLRHNEDAEEATQDAFVKVYQHLAGFGGDAKFSTWLYSIAYRTAISTLRKRRQGTISFDHLASPIADPRSNTTEADDRKRFLEQALLRLAPEDSALVTFYYLEELSVAEIVTITGMGASNVKVRLHRARKKLQEALGQLLGPETRDLLHDHA